VLSEIPFSVTCYSHGVAVSAIRDYFNDLSISASSLKLGNCNGSDNGTAINFHGLCDANITVI